MKPKSDATVILQTFTIELTDVDEPPSFGSVSDYFYIVENRLGKLCTSSSESTCSSSNEAFVSYQDPDDGATLDLSITKQEDCSDETNIQTITGTSYFAVAVSQSSSTFVSVVPLNYEDYQCVRLSLLLKDLTRGGTATKTIDVKVR